MTANRVIALCERNANVLIEDITLIDSGHLKIEIFGADASKEQVKRMRENLARLEEIIDGCGCHCV